jgi:hypothetical protein
MKKLRYILAFVIITFISCEKNIDIDFPAGEAPYVIEGYIENGQVPYVFVSRGASFLGQISTQEFQKYFIDSATVTMTVDGVTYPLTPVNTGIVPIYTNLTISGETGKTYDLKVEVGGKTFTSTTTILPEFGLDSFYIEPAKGDLYTKDSLVQLYGFYDEPEERGNYYRLLVKRNNDIFFDTSFGSVFNDEIVNGTKKLQLIIFRGKSEFQNNEEADFSKYGYFKRGDTVYVKWASITEPHYKFWTSVESQGSSFGNPFAPTVVIQSNIEGNGSIGIWGSYGAAIDTLIIP